MPSWALFAGLSALFAALVAIFGKIGIQGVSSNLAVAVRTTIILLFAWGIVMMEGVGGQIKSWSRHTWIFIALSAIATGLSWLFYYRALQLGPVSRVAPIDKLSVALAIILAIAFLGEKPTMGSLIGGGLVVAGALVLVLVK